MEDRFQITERNEEDIEMGYPFVVEEVGEEGETLTVITSLEELVNILNSNYRK